MCTKDSNELNPKRKALEIITNIFRKKRREPVSIDRMDTVDGDGKQTRIKLNSNSLPNVYHLKSPIVSSMYKLKLYSPISVRVSNINADMEALKLSRNDNPFIQQTLEKISSSNLTLSLSPTDQTFNDRKELFVNYSSPGVANSTCSSVNSTTIRENKLSLLSLELDDNLQRNILIEDNIHKHLVRSPPPQFPQNFSQFIYETQSINSTNLFNNNQLNRNNDSYEYDDDVDLDENIVYDCNDNLQVNHSIDHQANYFDLEVERKDVLINDIDDILIVYPDDNSKNVVEQDDIKEEIENEERVDDDEDDDDRDEKEDTCQINDLTNSESTVNNNDKNNNTLKKTDYKVYNKNLNCSNIDLEPISVFGSQEALLN